MHLIIENLFLKVVKLNENKLLDEIRKNGI